MGNNDRSSKNNKEDGDDDDNNNKINNNDDDSFDSIRLDDGFSRMTLNTGEMGEMSHFTFADQSRRTQRKDDENYQKVRLEDDIYTDDRITAKELKILNTQTFFAINCIHTYKDPREKRGAVIRAVCILTRHHFWNCFRVN